MGAAEPNRCVTAEAAVATVTGEFPTLPPWRSVRMAGGAEGVWVCVGELCVCVCMCEDCVCVCV